MKYPQGLENPAILTSQHVGYSETDERILLHCRYKLIDEATEYDEATEHVVTFVLNEERVSNLIDGLRLARRFFPE